MSKCDFESMMISKFINIKTTKNVIAMIWLNLRWYEFLAKNRDKVCSTKNSIHMNDSKVRLLVPNKTRAHHPHASSLIWHVPLALHDQTSVQPHMDTVFLEFWTRKSKGHGQCPYHACLQALGQWWRTHNHTGVLLVSMLVRPEYIHNTCHQHH